MKKRFNDTGVCIPEEHYMVDISKKTSQIFKMVQNGLEMKGKEIFAAWV